MSHSWTQNFDYDGVNRLTSAVETGGWSRGYGYDRYGNRWVSSSTGLAHSAVPAEPTSSSHFTASNNRLNMTGMEYDTAGNLSRYGNYRLSYDAEGRMKSVTDLSYNSMAQYVYDGDGRRVKKTWVPTGEITYYFYDALGQLAVEYSTQSPTSTGTSYLFTDMLGSVRTITNDSGAVVENNDYLPFGRMLSSADNGRSAVGFYPPAPDTSIDSSTPHKFTGKERDETGLDFFEARYYSGAHGRFISPDLPFVDQTEGDPQSWNLYTYVRNNPLTFIDPTGRFRINCDVVNCGDSGATGPGGIPLDFWIGWLRRQEIEEFFSRQWEQAQIAFNKELLERRAQQMLAEKNYLAYAIDKAGVFLIPGNRTDVALTILPMGRLAHLGKLVIGLKITKQMGPRGWTVKSIQEAIESGKQIRAVNKATGNPATRYVHPKTGQSVVIDDVTGEVIHVGGRGFRYGPGSGDLP
jgi:RHS repeat-associated protein